MPDAKVASVADEAVAVVLPVHVRVGELLVVVALPAARGHRHHRLLQEVKLMSVSVSENAIRRADAGVAPAVQSGRRLRITLYKSGIGYKYDQKRTLAALGLKRLNMTVEQPDNPSVRGMLAKVQHLVLVEEIGS